MDYRLLAVGSNLLVASILLSIYGYLVNDGGLLGIGFSTAVLSTVLIALAYEPNPQTRELLIDYTTKLSKALASLLEDLDLLPPRVRAVWVGEQLLLTISKGMVEPAGPGIGVVGGTPYIALPLEDSEFEVPDLSTVAREQVELSIERLLREVIEASDISVKIGEGSVRISIYGVSEALNQLSNYPINPLITVALNTVSRCLRRSLTLVDYSKSGRDHHLLIEVEGYVG